MLVYGSACFFCGGSTQTSEWMKHWMYTEILYDSMLSNPLALAPIKSHGTLTSWWTSKPYAILLSFTSWGHCDPIPAVHHHYHHYHSFFVAVGAAFWIFTSPCYEVIPIYRKKKKKKLLRVSNSKFFGGGANPGQNYAPSKGFQHKFSGVKLQLRMTSCPGSTLLVFTNVAAERLNLRNLSCWSLSRWAKNVKISAHLRSLSLHKLLGYLFSNSPKLLTFYFKFPLFFLPSTNQFFLFPTTAQTWENPPGNHQPPGSTSWSSTFTPWWPIILKSSSQSIAVFTSVISPKKKRALARFL